MIVIYAPFPAPERVRGGWMGRIAAVERLFAGRPRVYVYPGDPAWANDPFDYRVQVADVAPAAQSVWLDLRLSNHHRWLSERIEEAEFVYAHTCHSSHHLLPYYRTGKIVTDLHGIAPEEEELQGHPDRARFFAGLEEDMIRGSGALVTVTEAMLRHFRTKYPGLTTPAIRLPILEAAPADVRIERPRRTKPRVVYAGGVQSWQNVDLMLSTVARCRDQFEFRLYTDAIPALRAAAERHGVAGVVQIATAAPEELPSIYAEADYGFVLRDDLAINRVSCPTKLSEYLMFGVVPIVQFEAIGDFLELGYRYVRLVDFVAGRLPDGEVLGAMRRRNLEVLATIQQDFARGSRQLRELVLPASRESMRSRASLFLTTTERAAFYPVRGARIEIERADGRHVIAWPEEVSAAVDRTLDLPGAGPVRSIHIVPAFPPFVLSPVQAELVDDQGTALSLQLRGNHWVDRHGNWVFDGRSARLQAELRPSFAATRLRIRSEFLLVGPEALIATAGRATAKTPWSQRLVASLRRRIRGGGAADHR